MSRLLKALEPARFAEFTTLFAEHADVPHLVVTFLALLELAREQLVERRAGRTVCADLRAAARGGPAFALAADDDDDANATGPDDDADPRRSNAPMRPTHWRS